jgi:hypothetical protein
MSHIVLTRRHIMDALEVKPHVFREWAENLEPYRSQPTQERVPRKFGRRDLLFFCIVKWLIAEFQLPINVIARFSGNLAECLAKPMSTTTPGCLFVNVSSGTVSPIRILTAESGIVIELAPHIRSCNAFFDTSEDTEQTSLPFGLTDIVAQRRKGEVAS